MQLFSNLRGITADFTQKVLLASRFYSCNLKASNVLLQKPKSVKVFISVYHRTWKEGLYAVEYFDSLSDLFALFLENLRNILEVDERRYKIAKVYGSCL
ncbi:MAG: hypothetical protein AAF519_01930 [Bacteroidota bacterium]